MSVFLTTAGGIVEHLDSAEHDCAGTIDSPDWPRPCIFCSPERLWGAA